jgi:hypothetical protein
VVDFGVEDDFGRRHGVVFWEEEFQVEKSGLITCSSRSLNFDEEVSEIGLVRSKLDAWHWIGDYVFRFFYDSWTWAFHFC